MKEWKGVSQNVNNNYFWVMNDKWFLFYLYPLYTFPKFLQNLHVLNL